ncbi:MAG: amidohydrolase family protein, partial [Corynebacterium variabile]
MSSIDRHRYQEIYGPTTGDTVRLADTDLTVRITRDFLADAYGDESVYGGGKAVRDGMAQDPTATAATGALDTVITGVIVLDAVAGVVKGDVGIRDGRIVKIGKAGNPNTQDGVDPELVMGPGTEVIAGEHRVLTAGGVDSHIHYITPQQAEHGLAGGITTFFGGGTGPAEGTLGTTCTPGPNGVQFMLRAAEGMPVNTG